MMQDIAGQANLAINKVSDWSKLTDRPFERLV